MIRRRPVQTREQRLAFVASRAPKAQEALARMSRIYGQSEPDQADIIIARNNTEIRNL